jgi:hypothetical protein
LTATVAVAMTQTPAFAKGPASSAAQGPPAHSEAAANSNGKNASDRDFGRDRAEDRMSAQGLAHSKAGVHKGKKAAKSGKKTKAARSS